MVHTWVVPLGVCIQDKGALRVVSSHRRVWARQIGYMKGQLPMQQLCKTEQKHSHGASAVSFMHYMFHPYMGKCSIMDLRRTSKNHTLGANKQVDMVSKMRAWLTCEPTWYKTMRWVLGVAGHFYILSVALNIVYTYECPHNWSRDCLTSSIFRVQTNHLSITLIVVFWAFQGEANRLRTVLCVCREVSQPRMQ